MTYRRGLMVMAVLTLSTPALATGPFEGVFVTEPEACAWLEEEGSSALFDHDFLAMSLRAGIVANEFRCEFLDAKETSDGSAIVVTAFCEYPGEPYADLLALREFEETSITVTSSADAARDAANDVEGWWGTRIYHRCDNLKDIPF